VAISVIKSRIRETTNRHESTRIGGNNRLRELTNAPQFDVGGAQTFQSAASLAFAKRQRTFEPNLSHKTLRTEMTTLRLFAPEAFDVGDAFIDLVDGEGGAEFEDFDVVRFDAGFERGEINIA
jgi:hypothetical protein